MKNKPLFALILLPILLLCPALAFESYEAFNESNDYVRFSVNNLWILISAALVFIMHLGFSTLESGLCQQKNTVNILFKNVFIICMGVLSYYFIGFNTHYPGDFNGWIKLGGPIIGSFSGASEVANLSSEYADYTYWADFIFQAMFAATAATIVSGAVAERIKLSAFMIYSVFLVSIAYTVIGSWHWGGGWLSKLGFHDFAGSTVVHAFGGFSALAFVAVLGPRLGKYTSNGIKPILSHNLPLATIGVFLLFLGWFGFNGGSVLSADAKSVSYVFVTTALAACAGGIASMITSWLHFKKPDLSMTLNGILAGLVGITAGADVITLPSSIIVGAIAGVIVVFAIYALDLLKLDDPVGAIAVHGVCGIWGTLATGLPFFNGGNLDIKFGVQVLGVIAVCSSAFLFSLILAIILKETIGIRVSEAEETLGLDIEEHRTTAYHNS